MPGHKGNMNAVRTLRKTRPLAVGTLPREMEACKKAAIRYRQYLENAVLDLRGELNCDDVHEIDLAVTCELHVHITRWLLRNRLDTLSATEIAALSAGMPKAKERRNRAIHRLRLGDVPRTVDALFEPETEVHEEKSEDESSES